MRPIDADALSALLFQRMGESERIANDLPKHSYAESVYYGKTTTLYETLLAIEREIPTLDYAPVRHGEWIHDINNLYACSECLMRQTQRMRGRLMNFCPNCGANMMPLPEAPKEG